MNGKFGHELLLEETIIYIYIYYMINKLSATGFMGISIINPEAKRDLTRGDESKIVE